MLRVRLIVGTAFAALLLAVVLLDYAVRAPYPGWLILCLVLGCLAAGELTGLLRRMGAPVSSWLVHPLLVGAVIIHWVPFLSQSREPSLRWLLVLVFFLGATYGGLLAAMYGYVRSGTIISGLVTTSLAVLYLSVCASAVASVRWLDHGLFAVLLLIVATKACDTGAFFVGVRWGRRPLAPRISPKKTVEGAIGGVLIAGLCSALLALGAPFVERGAALGTAEAAVLGVLLGAWGQAGDLFESCLKRQAGVKDSSDWLPGLGGVLDILDSVLWNGPIFVLWWELRQVFLP